MQMSDGSSSFGRTVRVAVIGVASASVLAACGSSGTSSSASAGPSAMSSSSSKVASGTPYVMHVILPETGQGSFLGVDQGKALKALVPLTNSQGGIDGHPLQMSIQDNVSSPATAVSLATPLVSSHVPLILNGSQVPTDAAVDALATPNGPFIYDLSPGVHPKSGSMVFSAGLSTTVMAQTYLTYLKSKGITKLAEINSTDGSGVDGWNQLKATLAKPQFSAFHLLAHETFDPTAVSVTSQLSVIKAQNPQALIIWTIGTPLGTVLQGMSSLGMENIPTVTSDGNASYAELTHFSSILPQTFYFPVGPLYLPPSDISNAAVRSQVQTFDKVVASSGGHPGNAWGLSWDAGQLLIRAVKKLGINATATQILNYMQNLHNVPGVFGLYNTSASDHRGLGVSNETMTEWNGSSFTPVSGPAGAPLTGGSAG